MNIEVNCEYKEDLVASVSVTELAAIVFIPKIGELLC